MTFTKDIAARIDAHLRRFEADKVINTLHVESKTHRFYHAGAWANAGWVNVRYVSYQGVTSLKKADAEKYLAWLDAGNVGRHWEALREDR